MDEIKVSSIGKWVNDDFVSRDRAYRRKGTSWLRIGRNTVFFLRILYWKLNCFVAFFFFKLCTFAACPYSYSSN